MDTTEFDVDGSTPVNITVTLNDAADYDVSSTDPITVAVKDNDAPTAANPIITITRAADYIVEGGTATFTLTSTGTGGTALLPSADKVVNVVFSANNDDFIAASETMLMKTETITMTGEPTASISLETKTADPASIDFGVITATLLDGDGYVLSATESDRVASITLLDKLPEISIAAINPVDEADGMFTVTLESDIELMTGRPITITSLTVDDANTDAPTYAPAIKTSSMPIQIPSASGNDSVEVEVEFTAVSGYVGWDDLTVSLGEVADDLYTVDTNANERAVTIRPTELSSRTVSIDAPVSVVEGEPIALTLTASEALGSGESIMVELMVEDASGTFLDPSFVNSPYEITDTTIDLSVPVNIPTQKQTSTTDGSISIAVVRGPNYEPHATDGTKTVAVQEEDLLPKVTIALVSGAPTAYDEGEIVTFEISASPVTTPVDLTVYVMLADDDTGDFLADATTTNAHTVTVTTGSSKTLPIPTVADTVDEGTGGMITATIQADPNQADRDEQTTYLRGATDDISVMASITDNDDATLPSVTISAGSAINEGDEAEFTLATSGPTLTAPLVVSILYDEEGTFIDRNLNNDATIMVTIPNTGPNAGTAVFRQGTVADAISETDGSITARVLSDPETTDTYAVGEQVTATVNVMDNDVDTLPSITISRKGSSTADIAEGMDAVFEVSAADPTSGTPPTNAIMVDIRISQVGNFLRDPDDTEETVAVMSGATADLTVMTAGDDYDEDNGSISATILTDTPDTSLGEITTYGVGADNTAMIGVMDDDDEPMASISETHIAVEGTANDADGLVVMLTAASRKVVQVAYEFADGTGAVKGTDYMGTDGILTFTPDSETGITPTSIFVPFSIVQDDIDDPDETFTITLSNVANGNASVNDAAKVATVTIDQTPIPNLTLASTAETTGVTEGLSFQFTITSDIPIPGVAGTDTYMLDLEIDDSGASTGAAITEALEIGAGERIATFTVTMNSEFDVDSSTPVNITVTLNDAADYDVSSTDPITVAVKDNDAPTAANPIITITRAADYIVEGGNATFTVTSTGAGGSTVLPSTDKDINVVFTTNHADFIATSETSLVKMPMITSTGESTATVSLATKIADPASIDFGIVTATLMDGAGYVLSSTAADRSASIALLDKLPEISIAAINPVDEADGMFTVTLESDIPLMTGRPITITSLTVDDANTDAPTYAPAIKTSSIPIQIPSASSNDSVGVEVEFTAVSGYVGWDDLTVSLGEVVDDLYTVDTTAR